MRFVAVLLLLAGCTSPEAERVRGGGPGADVGNRGTPVVMHEGSAGLGGSAADVAIQADNIQATLDRMRGLFGGRVELLQANFPRWSVPREGRPSKVNGRRGMTTQGRGASFCRRRSGGRVEETA